MKNLRVALLACLLGAGLTACGESSVPLAPEGPRFDGGGALGSGHRSLVADTTTTVVIPSTETTTDSPAERGGGGAFGSGN